MLLNSEKTDHDRFGELSALAAIGQVTAEEYQELRAHLELCSACREEYRDFSELLLKHVPLAYGYGDDDSRAVETIAPALPGHSWQGPSRLGKIWQSVRSNPVYVYAAIVVLCVSAGVFAPAVYRHARVDRLRVERVANLDEENARLRSQVDQLSARTNEKTASENFRVSAGRASGTASPADDHSKLLTRNRDLESRLKSAADELLTLQEQANSDANRESELSTRLADTQATLSKLKEEMDAEQEVHARDMATIREQQERLSKAEERFTVAMDSVERDKRLLAADRDIRDLMGARNLRIIDVFDVDGKGKTRRPFGRVFFTEGKSLIFYAFDLEGGRPTAQSATFQAWGFDGSYKNAIASLGIFYRDEKSANRWVLKFDDPDVLSEIDSVFVTVEPPGGSKKPTGNKLLAAYVKASLNHP